MPEQEHLFFKGVSRDVSPSKMQEGYSSGMLNFRILDLDGEGYAVTSFKGTSAVGQLPLGFVPIGSCEYLGVAYIAMTNPATGEGQIGSFPSPDGVGGWVQQYAPLMNYNGAFDPELGINRLPLSTTLFAWNCDHQLEMQARADHDGTVNLYMTDFLNPLMRVNTGMHHATGLYTTRMLWDGEWHASVNVFHESCQWPVVSTTDVIQGGSLEGGNYFLYFAYVNENLEQSSYLTEHGPVQVARDTLVSLGTVDGGAGTVSMNKTIKVVLTGLDLGYRFIRVAVLHYQEGTFNTYALSQLFPIDQTGQPLEISITGDEEVIDETIAGIIQRKDEQTVVRTIAQVDNMLWGGNWKSPQLNNIALAAWAAQIPVGAHVPTANEELGDFIFQQTSSTAFQYKDFRRTMEKVGYFRGEAYTFAVVLKFLNGAISKPLPMEGSDAWFGGAVNDKGIFRFPSNMNAGYEMVSTGVSGQPVPKALGVTFDTSAVALPSWWNDVCGFWFVRGERKPDLVYQGFSTNAWNMNWSDGTPLGYEDLVPLHPGPWGNPSYEGTSLCFAELFTTHVSGVIQIPFRKKRTPTVGSTQYSNTFHNGQMKSDRWGIFSTDHFFDRQLSAGVYDLVVQGWLSLREHQESAGRHPNVVQQSTSFTPALNDASRRGRARLFNVAERNYSGVEGMCSGFLEGESDTSGGPVMWFSPWNVTGFGNGWMGNRRILQRNYIGARFDDTGASPVDLSQVQGEPGVKVVNVYSRDVTPPSEGGTYDLVNKYDPATTLYYPISEFIPASDWLAVSGRPFFRGDCFLQRTYHRHMHNGHFLYDDSDNGEYSSYGNLVGMVQECRINTAMRYMPGGADGDPHYYPEHHISSPNEFVIRFNSVDEARNLNQGYDKTLGGRGELGFDAALPGDLKWHPTRIRYSNVHVPGSFSDGYVVWDHAAYKDFDHAFGQIMKIGGIGGNLMNVQEMSIHLHPVHERAVTQDPSGARLILGDGDVLPEKAMAVSTEHGSQHQWSVVRGSSAWFGYDAARRSIWRLSAEGFDLMSARLGFRRDVEDLSVLQGMPSNAGYRYPDAPVCVGGVSGWYNPRAHEVGWSFIFDIGGTKSKRSIAYDEMLDAYLHERSLHSAISVRLNKDFYPFDPEELPLFNPLNPAPVGLWHADMNPLHTVFYGRQERSRLSYVSNPHPSKPLVFDGAYLSSNDVAPMEMSCRTQFQEYMLSPFLSVEEWERPVYEENRWKMPLLRATAVFGTGNQDYLVGSKMRGRWIENTFAWQTSEEVHIDSAMTKFRPSLQ